MSDVSVPVVLGSTRQGRKSPRVAGYMVKALEDAGLRPELVDLVEYDLPILRERLKNLDEPPESVVRFGRLIGNSRAVVVVSPEYNGACPGVLKNAIDYLNSEYENTLFGIVAVSSGAHGGGGCLAFLSRTLTRLGADIAEKSFKVNNVAETFSADGRPLAPEYRTQAAALAQEIAGALE